jgi:hypothetical protein
MGDYSFTVSRDSTIPEGRARTLKRMAKILAHFPNGVSDRANCFFHGLTKGWVLSHVIGLADADEVDEMLPPRPQGGVIEAIPYGPDDVIHPEVDALEEEGIPEGWWFEVSHAGTEMPERAVLAWLGCLRGELEGHGISQAEYDKLRALLPPVRDDLTPLVAASQ